MDEPFDVEEVFEPNIDLTPTYYDNYIAIDDYYKHPDLINKMLVSMPKEKWKQHPESRNWIDYYDTRPYFNNSYPVHEKCYKRHQFIYQLIRERYGWDNVRFNRSLTFNVFKHIAKGRGKEFQHHPHKDKNGINTLVYLDKYESGGTALYRDHPDHIDREDIDLIIDISKYSMVEVIPHKFNRMVIFHGDLLHGAYIQDNSVYENNWRITQASLCRRQDDKPGLLIL